MVQGITIPSSSTGSLSSYMLGYTVALEGSAIRVRRADGTSLSTSTTDVGQAINDIIAEATDPFSIELGRGIFPSHTTALFDTRDDWVLRGQSKRASRIRLDQNITGTTSNSILKINNGQRWTVRDLAVDGSTSHYQCRHGIEVSGSPNDYAFHSIWISYGYYDCFHLSGTGAGGHLDNIDAFWGGRHCIFANMQDTKWFGVRAQSSTDSCILVGSPAAGGTPAYETANGQSSFWYAVHPNYSKYQNYEGDHGAGSDLYAGMEVYAESNHFDGVYLDRNFGCGMIINSGRNTVLGGRAYQNNYGAGAAANYDILLKAASGYNTINSVVLQASGVAAEKTLYGVEEEAGGDYNIIAFCRGGANAHTTGLVHKVGANSVSLNNLGS